MSITYEPEPDVLVRVGEKVRLDGRDEALGERRRDFPKRDLTDPDGNVIGWVRIG